jgi:hypothetical protein
MNTLSERLRIKASMIDYGERIAWGSETAIMREAADKIEELQAELLAYQTLANDLHKKAKP